MRADDILRGLCDPIELPAWQQSAFNTLQMAALSVGRELWLHRIATCVVLVWFGAARVALTR